MSNPTAPSTTSDTSARRFFHGTRADLKPGDLIQPGYASNYVGRTSPWVYFSETLNAAAWGAELARGRRPWPYLQVEPTGPFMDDPNLTDKKYPGNPTKSSRSQAPLAVVASTSTGRTLPEEIKAMKDGIAGLEPIDD
ncbi:MAG: NAD(+)--rifampin ADP-ribosyltransferase [Deltaproteobacteria bacterium]|nr:NAD(+)--rifampin ADP-ribosyltransferase [Deltaproteobacteria bacterium]